MKLAVSIVSIAVAFGIFAAASRSWSDAGPSLPSTTAEPEPITGSASTPVAGSESKAKAPFGSYDPGGDALWSKHMLTSAETQVVDRGKAEDFTSVNNAYVTAAKQRSARAKAEAAATQLGGENLETIGVVR